MVVMVDFAVPADQFALGRLFETFPAVAIELERVIPLDSGVLPLIWVSDVDVGSFERELRTDPMVRDVKRLTEAEGRTLLEIDWSPEVDGLVQPMVRNHADLLRGRGGPETWEFRVQFQSRDRLAAFRDDCLEHGVHLDVRRIHDPELPTGEQRLSDAQRAALQTSYEEGYWNVPRETDLGTLGDLMDISDTAASQRLRRGVRTLIEEYVVSEVDE